MAFKSIKMAAKFKKYGGRGLFGDLDMQSLTYVSYDEGLVSECFAELDVLPTLNDKVTKIAVFRDGKTNDRTSHVFVVFQTDNYFYSVERWPDGIVIQSSKDIEDVTFSLYGNKRKGYILETEWVDGEGTVNEVVKFIEKTILLKTYHFFLRNCQTFAALIFKKFSKGEETFHKYRVRNQKYKLPSFGLRRIKALVNSLL